VIHVTAGGRKGREAVSRKLATAVNERLEKTEGVSEELRTALFAARDAANRMIALAPRGSVVVAQLQVSPDPVGGWQASALVDVCHAGKARG
jgi:hypothetical protein